MVYELRIYTIAEGKKQAIFNLFEHTNLDNFKRVGIGVEGLWYSDEENKLYYILEFKDEEDKEKKWGDFYSSKDWQEDIEEFKNHGNVVLETESYLLKQLPFFNK